MKRYGLIVKRLPFFLVFSSLFKKDLFSLRQNTVSALLNQLMVEGTTLAGCERFAVLLRRMNCEVAVSCLPCVRQNYSALIDEIQARGQILATQLSNLRSDLR